jgi:hypothetical protein
MKTEPNVQQGWILPSLDVTASLVALAGLLPMAGGLPGIASQGQPLMDSLWFTANLGGALLLLAGGMKLILRKIQSHTFVGCYAAFIGGLGTLRLEMAGYRLLIPGWLIMTLCVGGLLFSLRRAWLWVVVGSIWCLIVLGFWSVGGVISFLSTETQELSLFLPLQIAAVVFVLVLLVVHLKGRHSVAGVV